MNTTAALKTAAPTRAPWLMLAARSLLFFAFQALFALILAAGGAASAWEGAAAWWPFSVTLTNLVCLVLLIRLFRAEGRSFWSIFRLQKEHLKGDVLALLGFMLIAGPIAYLPNILLATWLFGEPMVTVEMLFRPLPLWAALASLVIFPATQGLVKLPTYFLYAMPRIKEQTGQPGLALALASLALGVQHFTVPLLFDWRFFTWRLLMFIPFAFLVGAILRWRPRLMPYMAVVHFLIDAATAATYFMV